MLSQSIFSLRQITRATLLAFLFMVSDAWAISVSPSPSYTGSYTVSWSTGLGCTQNNDPPFYSMDCYSLLENGVEVAYSGYSLPVSGKAVGSYTYSVYYSQYVYGSFYDGYVVEGPATVQVLPPPPSFSVSDAGNTIEGNTMVFTVTRSGTTSGTYSVNYASSSGTAHYTDFTSVSGTLTFSSGVTSLPIYVQTTQDSIYENSQTILMYLSSPTGGATLTDDFAFGYITNDDAAPQFSINDIELVEGGGWLAFTVTKTGATELDSYVSYETAPGTAGSSDFNATSGQLSFTTSQVTQVIYVGQTQDAIYESTERMYVNLSAPGAATISDGQGYGDITNDDPGPTFSIGNAPASEGGTLSFTVTKSGQTELSHSVSFATANGTAAAGSDYTASSGTLTFTSGQSTQAISVATINDAIYEPNQTMLVNLSSPTNGASIAGGQGQGSGTISSDDPAPTFSINDPPSATEGGAVTFTVTQTNASDLSHGVAFATANGTATSADFTPTSGTLSFSATTSAQQTRTIVVTTLGDAVAEGNETFVVNLTDGGLNGGSISDPQGVGTINNLPPPGIPGAPTGPIGTSSSSVTLSWSAPSGVITHYNVERTFDGVPTVINTGSTATSYAAALASDGAYQFRVQACNTSCGGWSATHNVVRSSVDPTTGVPGVGAGSGDAGPSSGLTNDFNGIVSGSAAVAPSGAATYAIPIAIPPGTRGLQPSLALAYSSHGGEGVVGRGWSLVGASSAITRCGKTVAQDGVVRAVDYSANDRFCLDGQRLVKTSSGGVYGGNDVKYRTELESFRDVVSNGGTPSSPNSFTVRTGDGRTLYYGGTAGSNFQASAPNAAEVSAWLLRRVEDKFGNFYDVTYVEDEANGHYHVDRIEYTGHSQAPVTSPYASAEFVYENAPNVIKRYRAGSVTSVQKRLTKIIAKNAGATVREYVLGYNENEATVPPSAMSRLTSIRECAPTQATGTCTAPTTFDWIDEIGGMETTQSLTTTPGGYQDWADLNGDGRTDFIGFSGPDVSQHTVRLATATGFAASQTWSKGSSTNGAWEFADLDGDGDADFVSFNSTIADQLVSKSNGVNNYELPTVAWAAHAVVSGHAFVDMNADGKTDFVTWDNNNPSGETINYFVSFSTGSGYTNQTWSGPKLAGTPGWEPTSHSFHDVNSDGRADLVLIKGTTHRIYVNNGTGFDNVSSPVEVTTEVECKTWVDLNGDSLLDCVALSGTTSHKVSLWTGKEYVNQTWTSPWWGGDIMVFRDMNGDGLADYFGSTQIGFSTGTGYVTSSAWGSFVGAGTYPEFADFDGDGKPDFKSNWYPAYYTINRSQPVHLMRKVTDGLGMETVFEYKPLSDSTVHTKGSSSVYPTTNVVNAVHVVSRMSQSNGLGTGSAGDYGNNGYFDSDYQYKGFRTDKSGRGSLGFEEVTIEDRERKLRTVTRYSQTYPFTGLVTAVEVTVTDKLDNGTNQAQLISDSDRTYVARNGVTSYDGPMIKYVCLDTDTRVEYDVESGAQLRTTLTDNDPGNSSVPCDAFGNPGQAGTADSFGTPLTRRLTVTDHVANPDVVHRTDTVTYFSNDQTDWLLNRPTRQVVKPFVDGLGDATKDRTTGISYVSGKGVVLTVTREPEQSAPIKLTTTFGYDSFGNRTNETITPSETGGTPSPPLARSESVQYDSVNGRFPDLLTNAAGQVTDLSFDARFGAIATIDGPNATSGGFNDLITRTYDAFGRMKDERRPDGSYEVVYFKTVGASASGIADRPTAKVMIETGVQNTAWGVAPSTRMTPVRTFLDGLGRELRSRTRAFDSSNFVHVDTAYDARGRVKQSSEPYYEGQTPVWSTPTYDVLGRLTALAAADTTQSSSTDYDAFTVTTIDAGGRRNRLIADALGRTTRTENRNAADVVLAVTEYLYDKAGNLTTVQKRTGGNTLIGNTVITNTFDRLGRRLSTTDPDFGAGANGRVDFIFDSMSDLRRQQTPRLRAQSATLYTEFDYDKLGRMTARRDPSNDLLQTVTSTFTYDQVPAGCEAGKGHLTSEAITGGGEPGLTTTYCYSPAQLGRLANEQRTTSSVTYQTDFTYDVLGRLSQVKYPATTSYSGANRYTATYSYNPRGYLERVANGATVLYQTTGVNARGQIEKAYLGDGSRTTRSFIKNTDRLAFTNAAIGAPQPVQNFIYTYDAIGNVSARADLINNVSETFGYDALDRLTAATVTNGTGPHPVTYQYDDAAGNLGNLTHKSDISTLASASMSYSTTARPHALTTLNTGSATRTFTYNANGSMTGGQVDSGTRTIAWTSYELPASVTLGTISRTFSYGPDRQRYRQVSVSGATTRTYTYAGEHYVKEVEGSSTEHKLYLYANGEQVGYVSDDGTPDVRYFHKDHLGSITTIITNQNWAGREKLSYDAWGKRRSGTDWWSAAATATEERGYTGHEHLDNVTLIHMNGRLLDPKLGRAISADPFVPAPLYSQSYNRYAYVYNNPLKYTDPSGFWPKDGPRICFFFCLPGGGEGGGGGGRGGGGGGGPGYSPPPDMTAYYEALLAHYALQDAEAARQAAVQLANSWRVDHPAAKTDQEGMKPTVGQTFDPSAWQPSMGPPPEWVQTSGICLGGCHGTTPEGVLRTMTPTEELVLNLAATAITLPFGGEFVGLARGALAAKSVWSLGPVTRGVAIERALGGNLPSNFPVIDRFADGIATSIKSIDLGAQSYQKASALTTTLTRYIDQVAAFTGRTWGGATVRGADITGRSLELVVPAGGASAAQQAALAGAVQYGQAVGVVVKIIPL